MVGGTTTTVSAGFSRRKRSRFSSGRGGSICGGGSTGVSSARVCLVGKSGGGIGRVFDDGYMADCVQEEVGIPASPMRNASWI